MNVQKNIALVTGGFSGESVISRKSAETIKQHIDTDLFQLFYIDISLDGWYFLPNSNEADKQLVNKDNFSVTHNGNTILFDAVLMCIHGTPGEDGRLQGYFDVLNIPYTSCSTATSAITFNKKYTCAIAQQFGIHTAKSIVVKKGIALTNEAILNKLSLPVFVKPNNGGSSIGMSKVNEVGELQAAISKAFNEDNQVLIEEFISGREFTIGVFKKQEEIIALPITEIISEKEFFDYEAKYLGKSQEITPAEVDSEMQTNIEQAAISIYEIFNCNGIVRIDFIYSQSHRQPFMLEINTVPGQSAASIIPQQVKAKGWSLKQFYTWLLEAALNHKK